MGPMVTMMVMAEHSTGEIMTIASEMTVMLPSDGCFRRGPCRHRPRTRLQSSVAPRVGSPEQAMMQVRTALTGTDKAICVAIIERRSV